MSLVSLIRCLGIFAGALVAVFPAPGAEEPERVPADTATPKGPRRAGGGPENPKIKFKLPPPPVLTPQEAMKTFKIAAGFEVQRVAAEPLIEAPIALSWDDQGRLYVVEMRGFMHDVDGTGEDQPIGRVSRLEDVNGDGVMDKATAFADNLVLPRAVMAVGDGVLIGEPPNLTWYRDTDGDGVADKKEIVSDKFGTAGGQPEHMANSPTWMMDNWIWCSNHPFRYRFQNGKFTSAATQGFGQWGRSQDDWGRQFFNYNSDFLRCDIVPPEFYARNPRLAERTAINYQVMRDQMTWPAMPTPGVNRGYIEDSRKPDGALTKGTLRPDGTLQSCTAACGAAIYRGDLFPREFRGNAFIPEPSGNLVKRIVVTENDGLPDAKNAAQGSEFLTSSDERFRPVNTYTGPDGALYVVDMARGILQHKGFLTYYLVANIQERKLEQPLNLGRIYRIVPVGAKPMPVTLPREPAAIVLLLAHANGWVRDAAQRVLVERGDASVVEAVKAIATTGATPQARLHALWTLEGLGALTPDFITARLRDPDPQVRCAAVRLADSTLETELVKLTDDPSAAVRLNLAFALSALPGPEVEKALVTLLENGRAPVFGEAVASGRMGRESEFLEMLLQQPAGTQEKFGASEIFQTLAGCVMKERRASRVARLLEIVAGQLDGSPQQLALVTGMAGKPAGKNPPKVRPVILDEEPAALSNLAKHPKAKSVVARLDPLLTWPGKPGYVAPKIDPLTPEPQARFEKGKTLYATICAACHQPSGTGLAGLAPPLVNSEWVLGPVERPIRIVLHGLTGPIDVEGVKWQLEMPGLPIFTDEDLAALITYIRREWEHTASPVGADEVAAVRAASKDRTASWTAAELLKTGKPEKKR
ncbi:MAG TPA: c-type cytochrome [Chthoniobacteraceae bacterium]|nr:c-type cytochrome [Chthoniobacteraceae bacterium]